MSEIVQPTEISTAIRNDVSFNGAGAGIDDMEKPRDSGAGFGAG